jgi:hypothetical protein
MNGTNFQGWVGLADNLTGWQTTGAGDFNKDGNTDILWSNSNTGDSGFWLMNGTNFQGWIGLASLSGWTPGL